ncbi:short-chain dehydrogenase/reductase [Dyadobacter endophyticus]|uniref:Short-chain dehydrogenase/reductase n=1 Tax=Dyadobacter endophyticus TaxID=1749036 RepID=A0ABQ1YJ60_9BACT|nr:oxidoreductase [Dyadobacter endophyticus]GGH26627.1 short-chain dehydrogenase/reductase [Dyadobacter endophyticus]
MKTQKTWFITGASRGFGLEITKAVLAAGDKVVATVRGKVAEFEAGFNGNPDLLVVTMDVTNEQQVSGAVSAAIAEFGRIDVLVNNAGYGLLAGVEEASNEEVRQNYEVNVFGTLNVIRAVLPSMRARRSGHIINISSVGGLGAYIGWGLYGSTKFAVEGITEALAMEVAPLGIQATVVAPGFFRTNFLDESSLFSSAQIIPDYAETVGVMRDFAAKVSYKQPGDPAKLAQAFITLANAKNPPVHLPLGNDTLDRFRSKTAAFEKDIENWYDVITGTDHDDVHAQAAVQA